MASRGKGQSELIKACAAAHGVSDRSARNWREAGDKRWLDFLAERAVSDKAAAVVADDEDEPGLGIEFEIRRLRAECRQLAYRARLAAKAGEIEMESMLHRILDPKRETLRRLEKDNPDIGERSGDLIQKSALIHYANEVRGLLQTLPSRVATSMPQEMAAMVREKLTLEVETLMRSAAEIIVPTDE